MMTQFMATHKVDPPPAEEPMRAALQLKLQPPQKLKLKQQQNLLRIKGKVNILAPLILKLKGSLTTKRFPIGTLLIHLSLTLM